MASSVSSRPGNRRMRVLPIHAASPLRAPAGQLLASCLAVTRCLPPDSIPGTSNYPYGRIPISPPMCTVAVDTPGLLPDGAEHGGCLPIFRGDPRHADADQ